MEKTLQYQLSNGSWVDCKERTENFLNRCEKYENLSREKVIEKLLSGKTCRNDSEDWYSVCRYEPEPIPKKIRVKDFPEGKKLICGCTVYYKSQIMNASLGKTCVDHYDDYSG